MLLLTLCLGVIVALFAIPLSPGAVRASASDYVRGQLTLLTDSGGFPDWSPDGTKIYFSRAMEDDYHDVWQINPDGTGEVCLTCNHPDLPNKHQGSPRVHPDGRWLVFQAEKAEHAFVLGKSLTGPGVGRYNDLWALDLQTNNVYRLTDVSPEGVSGVILNFFSQDGTKLLWSHIEGRGDDDFDNTALAVADFVIDEVNGPRLENTVYYNPGPEPGWLEAHGWGPDDSWIYFACTHDAKMEDEAMDICRMDFASPTEVTRLTFTSGRRGEAVELDEHAKLSPLNDAFVWMSSQPYGAPTVLQRLAAELKTDLWIMNLDGSGQQRLTFFNEPGHPDHIGERAIVSENDWDPAGTRVVMRVQFRDSATNPDRLFILELSHSDVVTPTPIPTATPEPTATPTPTPGPGGTGSIKGTVTDANTGAKLSGVTVTTDTGQSATTNNGGKYAIQGVPTGIRTVTASKSGYVMQSQQANVVAGQTATVDFALAPQQ